MINSLLEILVVAVPTLMAVVGLVGITWKKNPLPPPPPPQLPPPDTSEEAGGEVDNEEEEDDGGDTAQQTDTTGNTREAYQSPLDRALDLLTQHIAFSAKRQFVGYRVVDERAIGRRRVESTIPSAGHTIRPIRHHREVTMLHPTELAYDDELFFLRVFVTQEALVQVPTAYEPIMEPVHEKVYEEIVRLLYLLVDASPSMSYRYAPWRPPVWIAIVQRLLANARKAEALAMLRTFHGGLGPLHHAQSWDEYTQLINEVPRICVGNGTNIGRALDGALDDMISQEFDEATIIIVTDGEDKSFNPAAMRDKLDSSGVQLHAIMLGVDNDALRACTDRYQIVDEDLTVYDPVINRPLGDRIKVKKH